MSRDENGPAVSGTPIGAFAERDCATPAVIVKPPFARQAANGTCRLRGLARLPAWPAYDPCGLVHKHANHHQHTRDPSRGRHGDHGPSHGGPARAPASREASQHTGHAAHDKHAGHSVAMFRDKFWISLLLTVPTVIWSGMIQHWFGYSAPRFPGSAYLPALFGTARTAPADGGAVAPHKAPSPARSGQIRRRPAPPRVRQPIAGAPLAVQPADVRRKFERRQKGEKAAGSGPLKNNRAAGVGVSAGDMNVLRLKPRREYKLSGCRAFAAGG